MKYVFQFGVMGRNSPPAIHIYEYAEGYRHYDYWEKEILDLIRFPFDFPLSMVSRTCNQCNALSREGKSLADIKEYIQAAIEYHAL